MTLKIIFIGIEHNIVAMGTVCPSPYLPPQLFNTSVMVIIF